MQILKGRDRLDSTTFQSDELQLTVGTSRSLKVGVIKEFRRNLVAPVEQAFERTLDSLKELNWRVEEVSLPKIELALACYYVLVSAEISSNLSRYDGLRYGQSHQGTNWEETISQNRQSGFMAENKRRIMLGTYVLSQGYYEAYYQKAQKLRTLLCEEFERAFDDFDVLLSPVSPTPAFELGSKTADPLKMYMADLMTVAPSLVGIPASSLPLKSSALPVGLQIMTPQRKDGLNLGVAEEVSKLQ